MEPRGARPVNPSTICHRAALALFALAVPAVSGNLSAQEPLYSGEFADGTYVAHAKLSEWHDSGAQPKLNGMPLFDLARPIRQLVCELPETPATPAAYVEYIGGDRLPCQPIEYRDGSENPFERLPPHLLVRPAIPIDPPGQPTRERLAVAVNHLRRVVWLRRGAREYKPATVLLADGGQVEFRSLRWTNAGVSLLVADGVRKLAFREIAELHLPERDPWEAYYETLAVLSSDGKSRLLRCDTYSGLAATTSLARFAARAVSGEPGGWYHLLQPAWSLGPMWIRHTLVQSRRSYEPHEPPLTWAAPNKVVQRSALGSLWRWQTDRNVQGQPLRSGGRIFAFGLGQPAYHELHFPLPACARAFRARLGIDEAAGRGGCARGLVYANEASGQPLYAGKTLIGSAELLDTGEIGLTAIAGQQRTLVLVADPNPADRPADADPLDVRDMLDWLAPQILLDRAALQAQVDRRRTRAISAWLDWDVHLADGAALELANRPSSGNAWDGVHLACRLRSSVTLARRIKLEPRHKYLALAVQRPEGSSLSTVEVRADGRMLAGFVVPEGRPQAPASPLLIPLTGTANAEVLLEVVQTPAGEQSWLHWQGLGLAEYPTATRWLTLEPVTATASSNAQLQQQPDGSLLASGQTSDFELYTVVADSELPRITALRLDVLADPRLPGGGPGRSGNGNWAVSDVRVQAAPRHEPQARQNVELARAAATYAADHAPAALAIDGSPQTAWSIWPRVAQNQAAVFEPQREIAFAGGTRLTIAIDQRVHQQHAIGRFRLAATDAQRPVSVEPTAVLAPMLAGLPLVLFHDEPEFIAALNQGAGAATLETADRQAGAAALKVTGPQRFNNNLPRMPVKIRRFPAAGEYRYLQFAWKLPAGRQICLQLAHDGQWGPTTGGGPSLRYYAGEGAEPFAGATKVSDAPPREWTVVTRDLFAEFGDFNLTGLSCDLFDAPAVLFDEIVLAPSLAVLHAAVDYTSHGRQ